MLSPGEVCDGYYAKGKICVGGDMTTSAMLPMLIYISLERTVRGLMISVCHDG